MVLIFVKRPASPLNLESIKTSPEDILCPGSEEEESADEDKREKKKLRREILGRQYLDGRPLFIQTANLKGPFNKGWVNPWVSKKRKYEVDDIRRFPRAPAATAPRTSAAGENLSTAKRRPTANVESALPSNGLIPETELFTRVFGREEPTAKRRKHTQLDELGNSHDAQKLPNSRLDLHGENEHHWLKTDRSHLQTDFRDQVKSPTPAPAVECRAIPATTTPSQDERDRFAKANAQIYDSPATGFTPVNQVPAKRVDKPPWEAVTSTKRRADHSRLPALKISGAFVAERALATLDDTTRRGHEEVKRLSHGAVRRAEEEDGYLQARKLSQDAASRACQTGMTPSRLAPYVSEALMDEDAASSAGLEATPKAPRPSPHILPPSTNQPEFKYQYARRRASTSSPQQEAPFVEAPEAFQPRARSESSSSSGSSEFAAALEAAQAKADSDASSYSSSPPIVGGHETTSVKKNTQAMRRLTFTSSGIPMIAGSRGSSRPSSSSSAVNPTASLTRSKVKEPEARRESAPPVETSGKLSQRSSKIGKSTRSSVILPEAQIMPDAPIQLAPVTSGPSTNLLETDKQSPRFPSLDEEDSYFDLSTQAAALKAQQRFKEEVFLNHSESPDVTKLGVTSPITPSFSRVDTTPVHNSARRPGSRGHKIVKSEYSDDEEPMSTQAMVDAMSPFAITTVKKKPPRVTQRTSFVPSPTKEKSPTPAPALSPGSPTIGPFNKGYISMSTSPSPSPPKPSPPLPLSHPGTTSKPPSSLTSFSILPNGTLTETSIYQDGQQPQEDFDISLQLDPFGTAFSTTGKKNDPTLDSADLNAAIEDAGSFLGDWDVETEARKEGSSSRKRETGPRGILSVARGSG